MEENKSYQSNDQNDTYIGKKTNIYCTKCHKKILKNQYYKKGVKVNTFMPKYSSYSLINFIKIVSLIFLFMSMFSMIIGQALVIIMYRTKSDNLYNYFLGDASFLLIVIGSILGLVTFVLFLVLFVLSIFNRKGWMRKSKSYFLGFISTLMILFLSIIVLYISQTLNDNISAKIPYIKNNEIYQWVNTNIFINLVKSSWINDIVKRFYENQIDTSFLILTVATIICTLSSHLYIKSVSKTLRNAQEHFLKK